jgi:type II secretory pathway pseudopilin PulG
MRRRQLRNNRAGQSGFTILEAVIAVVIIGFAAAGSTQMVMTALRALQQTRDQSLVQAAIDANKDQIDQLARSFTCCSGTCTTTPPASTAVGATKSCATTNPNDDRYYYPQQDDTTTTSNFTNTTTASEPSAVDQLCASSNNTNFMTPLKTAVDALAQPSPATRGAAVIMSYKMLSVSFTDSSSRTVRTLYVRPRMANYCS